MQPAAFATYFDTWAGPITAALVPFRTKRKGVTVTRYRWQAANGQAVGGFASPFMTVEGALRAIERHACFAGGVKAEAQA
jgi:hypothetical protein